MSVFAVVGFAIALVPIVISPGASFTLATQQALAGQRRAVPWVVAGTATGILCHAVLAALGLAALVMASSTVFTIVRLLGAVSLIVLGVVTLVCSGRPARPRYLAPPTGGAGARMYAQALLLNVLNVKAVSVYLVLAPQFLSVDQVGVGSLLVLASVHIALMTLWLGVWGGVLVKLRPVVGGEGFRRLIDRVGGTVLIALGVRTAVAA